MSDEATPKVDPKHYKSSGAGPSLVPAALAPFRAMLWAGVVLAAIGFIALLVGASANSYDDTSTATALGAGALQVAVPLFVGAGVVAGLGKRETGD